ncbi:hypothetical protein JC525_05740 [Alteromonas sp. IB21]|uniref:hypothetical protein n=1 Tax=Alteromonas sp. IB21 TaxID=2779369 RepID=UPI0018E7AA5A|nr:hypothetical protein [Alteromonas sp. IB21]MBJ2128433.1 hypothetical protein [Alteromonas sp. IB21]
MVSPLDKKEYQESLIWARKAEKGELEPIPCISGWMDVCGFGSALELGHWDLINLQKGGLLNLLSAIYQRAGHPYLIGVEPIPYETVLVINDGIARTIDLNRTDLADAVQIIFYLRDIFFLHAHLVDYTRKHGYGFRTVLAGGERVQYSPEIFTGNSVLQHDEHNISNFGRALLNKNFLHNPSQFQMNTAFAKAYSIDSLGSRGGFSVDRCYVESSFWEKLRGIPYLDVEDGDNSILLYFRSNPAFEIYTDKTIITSFKGIDMQVRQVVRVRVDESFEGEETFRDIPKA